MIDYEAPSSKRAIDALRLGDTLKQLLKFAGWLAGAGGEDLLADAVACVCDPVDGRPWDPARGSFTTHMRLIIRDLARRERRSARARREIVDEAIGEAVAHTQPSPEEALSNSRAVERLRRLGAALRRRVAHNPLTVQVFDRTCEGVEDAGELARLLGCTVRDIYKAKQQLAWHAPQVAAEDDEAQAAKMKELRQAAKKEPVTP